MKPTTMAKNGVSTEMVYLIQRLVSLIPWPARRSAMGDVSLSLLDGKHRVAETVFEWNRSSVEVGIHEFQTGIQCLNDISGNCSDTPSFPRKREFSVNPPLSPYQGGLRYLRLRG